VSYVPNELLSRLVGHRLFSVQFVLDYVQLHFDSDASSGQVVLQCDCFPAVVRDGRTYAVGDPGWADALWRFIPGVVTDTREATGTGLEVRFGVDLIRLHPTVDELVGAEIAMLTGFDDGQWMVWRPGEESFEDLA
jgi:hypothetical protein